MSEQYKASEKILCRVDDRKDEYGRGEFENVLFAARRGDNFYSEEVSHSEYCASHGLGSCNCDKDEYIREWRLENDNILVTIHHESYATKHGYYLPRSEWSEKEWAELQLAVREMA